MKCALCRREARLVSSHIIPEFLYETLYDDKHRFYQISVDPEERNRYQQKGLREQLLCEDCEQYLSVPEHYMSRLLKGCVQAVVRREGSRLCISELDYTKLKLFQLSVLWRAGVSSLEPFSQVQLGPHESRIREMLIAGDPGRADQYGCIMSALMSGQELITGLVVPPTWARLNGQMAYRFVFGGLVFVYVVSTKAPANFIVDNFALPNGSAVVKLQQVSEMSYLVNTVERLNRLGKLGSI